MKTATNLDELSDRLVTAILEDNVLKKDQLRIKVRSIIQAWIRVVDRPKNYDNIKTDKGILQRTIEQRGLEIKFWRDCLKDLVGNDNMEKYYLEQNKILKDNGYL